MLFHSLYKKKKKKKPHKTNLFLSLVPNTNIWHNLEAFLILNGKKLIEREIHAYNVNRVQCNNY